MFLPDYVEHVESETNPNIAAWAKREAKSAATEHDLLRRSRRPLKMSALAAFHFVSHILHLLLCFFSPDS